MRSIKVDYSTFPPTISKDEYLKLKESLNGTFDPNEKSILGDSTKKEMFELLFSDNLVISNKLEYLHFFNIVREFIVKKKTFRSFKNVEKYNIIKEIKEIRKQKIKSII